MTQQPAQLLGLITLFVLVTGLDATFVDTTLSDDAPPPPTPSAVASPPGAPPPVSPLASPLVSPLADGATAPPRAPPPPPPPTGEPPQRPAPLVPPSLPPWPDASECAFPNTLLAAETPDQTTQWYCCTSGLSEVTVQCCSREFLIVVDDNNGTSCTSKGLYDLLDQAQSLGHCWFTHEAQYPPPAPPPVRPPPSTPHPAPLPRAPSAHSPLPPKHTRCGPPHRDVLLLLRTDALVALVRALKQFHPPGLLHTRLDSNLDATARVAV